jgi:glycosyltransferase involved in cell wall biosynthesis
MVISTVPATLATFFPRQIRSMTRAGFEMHAVSSPGAELDDFGTKCSVTTHAVEMQRQPHPVQDTVSLVRLYRLMRRVQPHVVHAHTPKAGLLGMAAAKAARIPARLYTVHGLPLLTRSGPLRRILEAAERTSVRLSTRTYAVSHSARHMMLEYNLAPGKNVRVLGDGSCAGVDAVHFRPATAGEKQSARKELGIPLNAILFCFVGRLSRDKGIGVLADAWKRVALAWPEAHLLLVGEEDATDPVPAGALNYLRQHDRVHMTGTFPADRVRGVYAASDVCVLPTFREGLGQVTLEAGCMGIPMAATRNSGLDAIVEGVTGLLAPPSDSQALAHILIELAGNSELRIRLGRAAANHVPVRFCEQRVNRLWLSEYQQLLSECLPAFAKAAAAKV